MAAHRVHMRSLFIRNGIDGNSSVNMALHIFYGDNRIKFVRNGDAGIAERIIPILYPL
ncbi:hypothetical protein SDC9_189070 [bioreactor metagenome]|uniref:Uncharacterized protein n=1 Tax=bioreactor metagenome TaxID=1076179 RepID=A0A645HR40_9ZZZZ